MDMYFDEVPGMQGRLRVPCGLKPKKRFRLRGYSELLKRASRGQIGKASARKVITTTVNGSRNVF